MKNSSSHREPKTVERIAIRDIAGCTRFLELCIGDVTSTYVDEPLDLLVISAFPDDYEPVPGSVIGRLYEMGIDVGDLAESCELDWLDTWQCWLSEKIAAGQTSQDGRPGNPTIQRILCFEHGRATGRPEDLVGNVFRAISDWALTGPPHQPFSRGDSEARSVDTVRMPLLSAGDQGHQPRVMLEAIVNQAIIHLAAGLPVARVQIVIRERHRDLMQLLVLFGRLTTDVAVALLQELPPAVSAHYDIFLSYRRSDEGFAQRIMGAIQSVRRGIRVFVDQECLSPGCQWKPALLQALADCRNAMCVVTDGYPTSPECIDEFHAALCLGRLRPGYLLPLFCLTEQTMNALPPSLRRINFIQAVCPPANENDVAAAILKHIDITSSLV